MERPKIEVRELNKRYAVKGRTLDVLHNVNFTAQEAEFVSLIGPSGCGKSTIFNIMAGLEPATSGSVLVDGRSAPNGADAFAYMPQKDLLFPWRRVLDNTTLGLEVQGVSRREARERARQLFDAFGLSGFEQAYPFELSGGMRQRAALLRTVVQERSVILLDEPLGALDSLTRTQMQKWLETVWRRFRWTVFLITHDIREAVYLSDRVYVLTARPGSVKLVLEVDLPRPRELAIVTAPEFMRVEQRLADALFEETDQTQGQESWIWPD